MVREVGARKARQEPLGRVGKSRSVNGLSGTPKKKNRRHKQASIPESSKKSRLGGCRETLFAAPSLSRGTLLRETVVAKWPMQRLVQVIDRSNACQARSSQQVMLWTPHTPLPPPRPNLIEIESNEPRTDLRAH